MEAKKNIGYKRKKKDLSKFEKDKIRKCPICDKKFTVREKGGRYDQTFCSRECSRSVGNGGGRPSVVTPEVIAKLERVFAYGASDREACIFAGISPDALYRYCKGNPKFAEYKELLKETPVLRARQTVVKALENDSRLAMDFLKNKKSEEFHEKKKVDHIEPSIIQIIELEDQNNVKKKSTSKALKETNNRMEEID